MVEWIFMQETWQPRQFPDYGLGYIREGFNMLINFRKKDNAITEN